MGPAGGQKLGSFIPFASIHPTHRTPYVAVHVQAVGGIVLAVVLGFATGGPISAFALLGTVPPGLPVS